MLMRRVVSTLLLVAATDAALAAGLPDGLFGSTEAACTGDLVEGGVQFSASTGFGADESDCEILSSTQSTQRNATVLQALCIYAGVNTVEFFVVTEGSSEDEIYITGSKPAADGAYGMVTEETLFQRCK